jgi:hypothetical protein
MSGLSFLTPLALGLGALAVPIILLYMLRLRRIETAISSTFLWRQLVRDREANAPWQRLRWNWLMFLQLLILAALVITLARPFTEVKTITNGRIVLLLDASASMMATDVQPDRFSAARDIGLDLVDTLGPDDTMTVIRVGAVPEVLEAASRDKLVLREAISDAHPSETSADWVAAMTLAAAGAVGVDELKVVLVSDGGLPADLPAVPGDIRFVPVGASGNNLAISGLATSSLPGRAPQLFVRINNYSNVDTDVIVDIRLDDDETIFDAHRYTVPANGYYDIFETDLPEDFDTLTAHLTMPSNAATDDFLAVDNVAYSVRDRSGAGRVLLVTKDNLFLRQIFRSLHGVELFEINPLDGMPNQDFDLYVFDTYLPDDLPDGDLLIVNPPYNTDFFSVGQAVEGTGTISVDEDDPRTRNLAPYMNTVRMQEFHELGNVDWAKRLAWIDRYPIVVAGEIDARQIAVLPFDAHYPNTDLVLQPAWPILMAELASWFSPPRITDVNDSLTPGAPVTVRFIENADEAMIRLPNDDELNLSPDDRSDVVFADTFQPGLYRVELRRDGDEFKSEQFAVNLFAPEESQIAPQNTIQVGELAVNPDARTETGRREFWPWVAGIGLLILVVEWWFYHRGLRRLPRVTLSGLRRNKSGRTRPTFKRRARQSLSRSR